MWHCKISLAADQLRHRRLPGARARVVADVDGGVGLSSQHSVPEGQHLLAPILKYIFENEINRVGLVPRELKKLVSESKELQWLSARRNPTPEAELLASQSRKCALSSGGCQLPLFRLYREKNPNRTGRSRSSLIIHGQAIHRQRARRNVIRDCGGDREEAKQHAGEELDM